MARQRRELDDQLADLFTMARGGRTNGLSTPAMDPVGPNMIEDNAILNEHLAEGAVRLANLDSELTRTLEELANNEVVLRDSQDRLDEAEARLDDAFDTITVLPTRLEQLEIEARAAATDMSKVIFQSSKPQTREGSEQDLWINTGDGNTPFRYDLDAKDWVKATDTAAIEMAKTHADDLVRATKVQIITAQEAAIAAAKSAAITAAAANAKAQTEAAEARVATAAAAQAKSMADVAQAAAVAAAKVYADAQASGAGGLALEAAKADATAKANDAKNAAIAAAALDATAKKEQAEATAAADAKKKADAALAAAKTDSTSKANAAQAAAIAAADVAARATATAAAEAAEARAAVTAAADAKKKADAAQAAALAAAKTYADAEASGAGASALAAAKQDATTKANAAESAAIASAAADATVKKEQAEANAAADAKKKADAALASAKTDATTKANNAATTAIAATPRGVNVIVNGSFEQDFTGWDSEVTQTNGNFGIDTAVARSGGKSFYSTRTGGFRQSSIAVAAGQTWEYSLYYKTNADYSKSNAGGLRLQAVVSGAWADVGSSTLGPSVDGWTRSVARYVIPAGVTEIRARFAFNFTGTGKVWVDDICLENVTAQLAATAATAAALASAKADATTKANQARADSMAAAEAAAESARVAAGLANTMGRTWFQPAEPPAGAVNSWTGVADSSQSIQKMGGVEARRNLAFNPAFGENMGAWSHTNPAWKMASIRVPVPTEHAGFLGVPYASEMAWEVGGTNGMYFGTNFTELTTETTVHAQIKAVGIAGPTNIRLVLEVFAGTGRFATVQTNSVVLTPGKSHLFQVDGVLAVGTTRVVMSFYRNGTATEASKIIASAALFELGTSGTYFDGNTLDDREADLWIDTDERNTPKRWNGDGWTAVTDQAAIDAAVVAAAADATAKTTKALEDAKAHANAKAEAAQAAAITAAAADAKSQAEGAEARAAVTAAADAKKKADAAQAAALAAAKTYAAAEASGAGTAALAAAKSDATAKADAAEVAAITAAALDATAKKEQAEANAAVDAKAKADAALVAAKADAKSKADAALAAAKVDATTKADAAKAAAITAADTAAKATAKSAAEAAEARAAVTAAADAKTQAAAAQAAAVAAAKTYTEAQASGAGTAALTAAKADATAKADAAKAAAIAAAALDATAKKESAEANAAADAKTKADAALASAKTDATTKANNAKTAAVSVAAADAQTKADKAQAAAITAADAAAKVTATAAAEAAEARAATTAAADAQTKANAAQAAALAAAKTYADAEASGAGTVALNAAKADATSKANAAKAAAIAAAALDATAKKEAAEATAAADAKVKADKALSDAKVDASTKASAAQAAAIAVAAADATSKADAAKNAAVSAADTAAKATAKSAAEAAEARAATTASADAKVKADAAQAAALAAAKTYAEAQATGASSNTLAAAKADATAKADAAKAAAIAAAALDATAKKEAAEATAAADAKTKADAALASAKTDATTKANNAKSAAITAAAADATAKADAAKGAAITAADTAAKATAKSAAEAAEARAAVTAAADAKTKADAAQAAALAAAKTYADAEASGAGAAALASAKADATTKANAAKAAAITAAATDATAKKESAEANAAADAKTKADKALSDAKADATNKSNAARTAAEAAAKRLADQALADAKADAAARAVNLMPNGNFETGTAIGNIFTSTLSTHLGRWAVIDGTTPTGSRFIRYTHATDGDITSAMGTIPVLPGRTYRFGVWARHSGGSLTATSGIGWPHHWRTATLAVNNSNWPKLFYPADFSDKLTSEWQYFESDSAVPDGMAFLVPRFFAYGNAAPAGLVLDFAGIDMRDVTDVLAMKKESDSFTVTKMNEVANSKNATSYSTSAPSNTATPGTNAGDTWRRKDSSGNIIGEWEWSGTAWTQRKMTSASMTAIDVGVLSAGSATIASAVAQKIAAGTATIQKADIGNLTVTGTTNMATAVAQRMAANVGTFIELNASQLTASTATLDTAVVNKFYGEVVESRLMRASQMEIGGNINYGSLAAASDMWDYTTNPATVDVIEYGGSTQGRALRFKGSANISSIYGKKFAVFPGDKIHVQATLRNDGGEAAVGQVTLGLQFLDGAGATLAWDIYRVQTKDVVNHTNRKEVKGVSVVPDGAVFARPLASTRVPTGTADATKYAFIIDPVIRHQAGAVTIADGAVTADKLEADLVLTNRVVAGDPDGIRAEMSDDGFKVFNKAVDGKTYETVRMGVASTADMFAVSDAKGNVMASIDQSGRIVSPVVSADKEFWYKGKEIGEVLNDGPRGLVAMAVRETASPSYDSKAVYPFLALTFDVEENRAYRISTNPIEITGTASGIVQMHWVANAQATVTSQLLTSGYSAPTNMGLQWQSPITLNRVFRSWWTGTLSVLLAVRAIGTGAVSIRGDGFANMNHILVEDMGVLVPNTGEIRNGPAYQASAPPAVRNYTKEWTASAIRSYLPAGGTYNFTTNKMYQGLSPAGVGNLSSCAVFPDMTSTLSGATISSVKVYMYFDHWYNNAGGTARIGLIGKALPSTFKPGGLAATSGGWPKPGGRWVTIPADHWNGFKTGSWGGISLNGDSTYNTYGYANNVPRIQISYTK